jgi:hypothetical protein
MSENELVTKGGNNTGAEGTEEVPVEESQDVGRSINSQAKGLPWVQDALKKSAAYDKLLVEKAETQRAAEQARMVEAGNYEASLEMEKNKYKELEAKYVKEKKELSLRAEMASAGIVDLRAVKLFVDDFNEENESVSDYVARIKSDEQNSIYFSTNKRVPLDPPPRSGGGVPDSFDPVKAQEWLNSSDSKKRERAIKYYRDMYSNGTR